MTVQPANGGWARGSQRVGDVFLSWLVAARGKRRLDVGCGNGAFTELLIQRCGAAEVQGVDPSEPQLAFAHARAGASGAAFLQGDALALPFDPDRFDAAVMALVIFFVPDPAAGVVENGAGRSSGRDGRCLYMGYSSGYLAHRPVPDRLACHGHHNGTSPQRRSFSHGRPARPVDGLRSPINRDLRDRGRARFPGF
jgi:SAM-dependent methyltransferase